MAVPVPARAGTRPLVVLVAVVALALTPTVVATVPGGPAPAAAAAPDNYTPQTGVIFNNPLSDTTRRAIYRHLMRSIRSTRSGSTIRIASWNVKSKPFVDALLAAHRRGVSVRVLMSRAVARRQKENGSFERLQRELAKETGEVPRSPEMTSWAKACGASCRGSGGIAHTKMYLFSQVGEASDVVMVSSANLTEVAAVNQWNDIYTVVGRPDVAAVFDGIFEEMKLDQRATPPYRSYPLGNLTAEFLPFQGPTAVGDPVLDELMRIRCIGATGGTGNDGRTIIRIAQTAWLDERGVAIAERIRSMWGRGCDIRVVYAVMGREVRKVLERKGGRGKVPMVHIVQDRDRDGVYDKYLHMKAMSVSGVYAGDTSARVVWNGSANWSRLAVLSDEAGFRVVNDGIQRRYAKWINRLFFNPPPFNNVPSLTTEPTGRRVTGLDGEGLDPTEVETSVEPVDPYAKVQIH